MSYLQCDYILHFGVKGMKWGVRKDRDKSSGKHKSKHKDSSKEKKGLSDKQKTFLKGAAVGAGVLLAAYGGYKLKQVYSNKAAIAMGKSKLAGDLPTEIEHGLKKLKVKESLSETIQNANPLKDTKEGKNNCSIAGIAGFMRSRGFDVTAGSTGGDMRNLNGLVEECFSGARTFDGSAVRFGVSKDDAASFLKKKFGDNAEGLCSVQWKGGKGGHVFSYRIKEGVVDFFDCHSGNSNVDYYWDFIDPNGSLQVARLDNAEIIWDKIRKYLR